MITFSRNRRPATPRSRELEEAEILVRHEVVRFLDDHDLAWLLVHELAHLKLEHGPKQVSWAAESAETLVDSLGRDHRFRRLRGQGALSTDAL